MNWLAITAVAEVIGVLVVVGSLVYLAVQVKQSNETSRAATASHVSERFGAWLESIWAIKSERVKTALFFGPSTVDDLTPIELGETFSIVQIGIRMMEEIHYLYCNGFIDESLWQGYQDWFTNLKHRESIEIYFEAKQGNFSPAFCQFWKELPEGRDNSLQDLVLRYSADIASSSS